MKTWSFAKYAGCGNDFIIFDNQSNDFPLHRSVIQKLCHRHHGIGADGVLLLERSEVTDFRLRIFNSDGSEAEMCGNGMRCFVKWLMAKGYPQSVFHIKTMDNIITAESSGDMITLDMGKPANIQWNLSLKYDNRFLRIHSLNTGVPHAVHFVDNAEEVDILKIGSYLRNYSLWSPKGTNATFAQKMGSHHLKIRTYERGVEGETLACGTGAAAAAVAAAYEGMEGPIKIETRSGDLLTVEFKSENNAFSNIKLTGPATFVFQGSISLNNLT